MTIGGGLGRAVRLVALGGASALVLSGQAWAATASMTAKATSAGTTVEQVIVTAQKRPENVQDVPLTVTPVTAATIERLHVDDLKALTGTVPNVQINVNAGVASASSISIRGIGVVNQPSPFSGSEVGTVVDGVVQGTDLFGLNDQFDLERIEVLAGPQGTLFGANTTGGVVNIITRQPTGVFGAYGTITAGNYNRFDAQGAVNFPIIEGKLAGKIAFSHRSRDGWFTNLYNGERIDKIDSNTIRAYLKWTPSADLQVTLQSQFKFMRNGDTLLQTISYPGEVFYRPNIPVNFTIYDLVPGTNNTDIQSHTLTINWAGPFGHVTSITNYSDYRTTGGGLDLSGIDCFCLVAFGETPALKGPTPFQGVPGDRGWQLSQELRDVFHPVRTVEVLAGLFAMTWNDDSNGLSAPGFASPDILTGQITNERSWNVSGFTQAYWDITSRLRVQAGARVSWDKVYLSEGSYTYFQPAGVDPKLGRNNLNGAIQLPFAEGNPPNSGEHDWTNFGGKIGLDYKLTDDVMAYGYYARGFKSGGFNGRVTLATDIGPFNPETVDSFEIGFKSQWMNRHLLINGALFLNKWSSMQVAQTIFQNNFIRSVILNAGKATTEGFELQAEAVPFEGLRIKASLGYLHAKYDRFLSGTGALCPPPPAVQPPGCVVDYSGRDLPFAPPWSASIEPSYTFKVAGGKAVATVQYNFTDTKWGNYTQMISERLQAVRMLNANVSWGPENGHWSAALWGRNLTNKTYIADALDVPPLFTETVLGPPREFGVDFKFEF